jgi:hypothetical protein
VEQSGNLWATSWREINPPLKDEDGVKADRGKIGYVSCGQASVSTLPDSEAGQAVS